MLTKTARRALAGAILGAILLPTGFGQHPKMKGGLPDAHRFFEEVVGVYRTGRAYSDQGVLETEYVRVPKDNVDDVKTNSAKAQLAFARPNKLALSFGAVQMLCDGKEMVTVIDRYKRYFVADAPKEITLDFFRTKQVRQLLSGPFGTYHDCLLTLLFGQRRASEFFSASADLVITERLVAGKKCLCFKVTGPDFGEAGSLQRSAADVRLLVDPDSKRVVGAELDLEVDDYVFSALPPAPFELPPELAGVAIEDLPDSGPVLFPRKISWRSGVITDRVPPDSAFTFKAPPGYRRVDRFGELFATSPAVIEHPLKSDRPDDGKVGERHSGQIRKAVQGASVEG